MTISLGVKRVENLLQRDKDFSKRVEIVEIHLREKSKKKYSITIAPRRDDLNGKIVATDISSETIHAARRNAAAAGVDDLIEFAACDFSETPIPFS